MARTNSDDLLMEDDLAAAFLSDDVDVKTSHRKKANQSKMNGWTQTSFLDN